MPLYALIALIVSIIFTIGYTTYVLQNRRTPMLFELKFHKEANSHGEHGVINVTHRKHGLIQTNVRFVFVGLDVPPPLDLNLMFFIWEEAQAQGFIPHKLVTYGRRNGGVDMSYEVATSKTESTMNVHQLMSLDPTALHSGYGMAPPITKATPRPIPTIVPSTEY